MELETLQAANNLKYSIEKCKNQLNTLNSDRAMRTIRVYGTENHEFDLRTDQEEYADIVKSRFDDFIDGVTRDLEKKIKSLEKEFAKL